MIEIYSQNNVTVSANAAIPLNSTSSKKGCTTTQSGTATIQLNQCGMYIVAVDASATATEAGNINIQLRKNGVLQPQARSITTAADTTSIHALSFSTSISVSNNNTCRCCDSPTTIEVVNVGVGASFEQINVLVTKLC